MYIRNGFPIYYLRHEIHEYKNDDFDQQSCQLATGGAQVAQCLENETKTKNTKDVKYQNKFENESNNIRVLNSLLSVIGALRQLLFSYLHLVFHHLKIMHSRPF